MVLCGHLSAWVAAHSGFVIAPRRAPEGLIVGPGRSKATAALLSLLTQRGRAPVGCC
jgi:hypothetical protein